MRRMRGREWMINCFLWLCPLAGMAAFLAAILTANLPPPANARVYVRSFGARFFDVPGAAWVALLVGATGGPLVVACITRRTLGFFAGSSLLLLLAAGAGWMRTHRATDCAGLWRWEEAGDDEARLDRWEIDSRGGGVAFERRRWQEPFSVTDNSWRVPGRSRNISYYFGGPDDLYPAQLVDDVDQAEDLFHRRGFAATVAPEKKWRERNGRVFFAIALPYWFICFLAIPLPLAWTLRHRSRRRAARRARTGACAKCGYDLRATPDPTGARLAICPECGAAAPPPSPTS